ncbi:MAG: DUF2383 domain-containing protein [Bdellovibrionota bacterium]
MEFTVANPVTATTYKDTPEGAFLDKILRGEISAVEAYDQVLTKMDSPVQVDRLREFKLEHEDTVRQMRSLVRSEGQAPSENSGPWGTIVLSFVNMAKMVGFETALRALLEGEEHGLNQYREALTMNLSQKERDLIINVLVPRQERHISSLRAMIKFQ